MNSELPRPEEPAEARPVEPADTTELKPGTEEPGEVVSPSPVSSEPPAQPYEPPSEIGPQPGETPSPELPTQPEVGAPPPPPPVTPPISLPPEVAAPPNHRFATPSLILGVLSMLGILSCLCPLFWLPFLQLCPSLWTLALGGGALFTGNAARREIEASGGNIGGRDQADAGFIMGIIGVAFGLLAICLGVLWAVAWIIWPNSPLRTR